MGRHRSSARTRAAEVAPRPQLLLPAPAAGDPFENGRDRMKPKIERAARSRSTAHIGPSRREGIGPRAGEGQPASTSTATSIRRGHSHPGTATGGGVRVRPSVQLADGAARAGAVIGWAFKVGRGRPTDMKPGGPPSRWTKRNGTPRRGTGRGGPQAGRGEGRDFGRGSLPRPQMAESGEGRALIRTGERGVRAEPEFEALRGRWG